MELRELLTNHYQTRAWEKDNCFQSLMELQVKNDMAEAFDWLYSHVEQRLASSTKYEYEWKAVLWLAACARLSTVVEGENTGRICRYVLDSLTEPVVTVGALPKISKSIANQSPSMIPDPIRLALEQYSWPAPFSAAWAWDAVRQFQAVSQSHTICREEITVLLHDGNGVPARLLLDAFPGAQQILTIFPDPRYMTFVQIREDFCQSFQTAADFAWQLAEPNGCPPVEVRWRILRIDGEPLKLLSHPSAGAVFALGLAKLLSNFAALTLSKNVSELFQG